MITIIPLKKKVFSINSYLTLEKEYEQKQASSLYEKEQNIQKSYELDPKIKDIDDKIRELGIKSFRLSLEKDNKTEVDKILKELDSLKKKKEQLIKSLNICVEPKYECNICHDEGYITKNNVTTMCSCMKQKLIDMRYNQFNTFNLSNEKFENFNYDLFSDRPAPEKYGTKTSPRDNMKKIVSLSKKFIKNYDKDETNNLLFTGSTGVGKTFLSGCIANEFLKEGRTVIYQTAPLLLDIIFENKYGSKSLRARELYESLYSVDLLIIDDLGTENYSNAKYTELFSLINARLLNPKTKTIISSNLDLEKLNKAYDDRLFSRFVGKYDICKFYGDDIRLSF